MTVEQIKKGLANFPNSQIRVDTFSALKNIDKDSLPDLIFVDIEENPDEKFQDLEKVTKQFPNIPVFVLSESKSHDLILRAVRSGGWDYLRLPCSDLDIEAAIRRVLDRKRIRDQDGQIIAFFNLKGGLGNTTTLLNLSDHVCQLTGSKTAAVDLNPMGDLGVFINARSESSFAALAADLDRLDQDLFFSSLFHHQRGFYVLPVDGNMIRKPPVNSRGGIEALKVFKKYLDYTFLDLPHEFTELSLAALDFADRVFVLMHQDIASIYQTQKLFGLFHEVGYLGISKAQVIVNRFHKYSPYSRAMIEEMLGTKIFATIANDYSTVERSITEGKLIAELSDRSAVHKDLLRLAEKITGCKKEIFQGSLIRKLFSRFYGKRTSL